MKRTRMIWVTYTLAFAISVAGVMAQPKPVTQLPLGIPLGSGVDRLTGGDRGECVTYEGVITATGTAGGGYSSRKLYRVEDLEQLQRRTLLSVSASLGLGPFGADARFDYVNSRNFTKHRVTIIAESIVLNNKEFISKYKLSAGALEAAQLGPKPFMQKCGDSFVSARQTGGTLFAIIDLETKTNEVQDTLKEEIKTAATMFFSGASAKTSLESSLKIGKVSDSAIVRNGKNAPLPGLEGFDELLTNFPADVVKSPVPNLTFVSSYLLLNEKLPKKVAEHLESLQLHEDELATLNAKRNKAITLRNDYVYAKEHPNEFPGLNMAELDKALGHVEQIILDINKKARNCAEFPATKCGTDTLAVNELPAYVLPKRTLLETVPVYQWIQTSDGNIPPNSVLIGGTGSDATYVCAVRWGSGLHPGQLWKGNCYIEFGGEQVGRPVYEALSASKGGDWGPKGGIDPAKGYENNADLLVCRVTIKHPNGETGLIGGKLLNDNCHFAFDGKGYNHNDFSLDVKKVGGDVFYEVFYPRK